MLAATIVLVVLAIIALTIDYFRSAPAPSIVSEKPEPAGVASHSLTEPQPSRFGLRARVSYKDIETIVAEQLPEDYPVSGERRVCRRVIGIKACGTAQWDLTIVRTGDIDVSGEQQRVHLKVPLRFDGTSGIQGGFARTLGFSSLDIQGALMVDIGVGVNLQDDWCPVIAVEVDYRWLEKPVAVWQGRVDFDLESIVNNALDKQLASLAPRLNEALDCERFREQLSTYWRSYSFELDLPTAGDVETAQSVHLNIVPDGFAFSGFKTEPDKLGMSFEIRGTTVVASTPLVPDPLPLPPLQRVDFAASSTDFDLLLRADYAQLEKAIRPLLNGRRFQSETAAGTVAVTVNDIDLSGTADGVTVALDFTAELPGSWRPTQGLLYLNALPVIVQEAEQLRLKNISLSRMLDSTLWDLISTIFEGQIIAAIQRGSVIDLASRTRELEQRLLQQLQDPARTGGIDVRARNLELRLLDIVVENEALAARAKVSAELDIEIPLSVLSRPMRFDNDQ